MCKPKWAHGGLYSTTTAGLHGKKHTVLRSLLCFFTQSSIHFSEECWYRKVQSLVLKWNTWFIHNYLHYECTCGGGGNTINAQKNIVVFIGPLYENLNLRLFLNHLGAAQKAVNNHGILFMIYRFVRTCGSGEHSSAAFYHICVVLFNSEAHSLNHPCTMTWSCEGLKAETIK